MHERVTRSCDDDRKLHVAADDCVVKFGSRIYIFYMHVYVCYRQAFSVSSGMSEFLASIYIILAAFRCTVDGQLLIVTAHCQRDMFQIWLRVFC
jgi:hypothetical protein